MERRDVLRLLGMATLPALAGLTPEQVLAAVTETRRRADAQTRSGFFDPQQRVVIDQISELIMPATDTPGARAAGVVGFVEVIVGEWYHDDERAAFLRGLADVDARSQSLFGKPFLESTEPQQITVLTGMEAESRAMPAGAAPHFFARMKGLTLYGYYTSEIGSKQELLDPPFMPGRYDGAAPLRRAPAPAGGR